MENRTLGGELTSVFFCKRWGCISGARCSTYTCDEALVTDNCGLCKLQKKSVLHYSPLRVRLARSRLAEILGRYFQTIFAKREHSVYTYGA